MSHRDAAVPAACLGLIRAASWIVPASLRPEWLANRQKEVFHWWAFLSEHGAATRDARAELIRHCFRLFRDAFWRRFDRDRFFPGLRGAAGTPVFLFGFVLALLCAGAALSDGFGGIRSLMRGLPYRDSGRVVVFSQNLRIFGQRAGVPMATLELWKAKSEKLESFAAWSLHRIQSGSDPSPYRGISVTPDFFKVLGCAPMLGRVFKPGEYDAAILSYAYWKARFGGDEQILGRSIPINNRRARVIGVLPPAFYLLFYEDIHVWTLLDPQHPAHYYYPAIARLRAGAGREQAQAELRSLASGFPSQWQGRKVDLIGISETTRQAFYIYRFVAIVACVFTLATIAVYGWRLAARRKRQWKAWLFFAAKTSLLTVVSDMLWVEAMVRLAGSRDAALVAILAWFYMLLCFGLLWFSARDQKRRCPECLCRLSMPVTIGSWSSPLLEPVSTELVCRRGHGTLNYPETAQSASEPERWTALDSSWRDLFASGKE